MIRWRSFWAGWGSGNIRMSYTEPTGDTEKGRMDVEAGEGMSWAKFIASLVRENTFMKVH